MANAAIVRILLVDDLSRGDGRSTPYFKHGRTSVSSLK
jgi:hypothetical protein